MPIRDTPAARRSTRRIRAALAIALGSFAACGKAPAAAAHVAAGAGSAPALPLGTYTVRSRARFAGATLRYYDAGYGGSPSAELTLPGGGGRYTGTISSRGPDTVSIALTCRCRVGADGSSPPRYDDVAVVGRYETRALGGGRYELRPVDGGAASPDTLAQHP